MIAFWQNIPVLSWLLLQGKCAYCKMPISTRYIAVELLTAGVFLALWTRLGGTPEAVVLMLFSAILIAASFIDMERYIIPDCLSLGGIGTGLAAATASSHELVKMSLGGIWDSLLGVLAGGGIILILVQIGKKIWGVRVLSFEQPEELEIRIWHVEEEIRGTVRTGEDEAPLDGIFSRPSDRMLLRTTGNVTINGTLIDADDFVVTPTAVKLGNREYPLEQIERLESTITSIAVPRETMGIGDAKLLAAIGAFMGWQATIFSLFCGAGIALIVGVPFALRNRKNSVPFGPFLALGFLVWVWWRPLWMNLYF